MKKAPIWEPEIINISQNTLPRGEYGFYDEAMTGTYLYKIIFEFGVGFFVFQLVTVQIIILNLQ